MSIETPTEVSSATERMNSLYAKEFCRQAKSSFKAYCYTNEPTVPILVDVLIVGSALTDEFVEGESDLDFLYLIEGRPTKPVRKYLWQYINDTGRIQTKLAESVPFPIQHIDCNGVVGLKSVSQQIHGPIAYSLQGTTFVDPAEIPELKHISRD